MKDRATTARSRRSSLIDDISAFRGERWTCTSLKYQRIWYFACALTSRCAVTRRHRRGERHTWHSVGGSDHHGCPSCVLACQAGFPATESTLRFVSCTTVVMLKCRRSHSRRTACPPGTCRSCVSLIFLRRRFTLPSHLSSFGLGWCVHTVLLLKILTLKGHAVPPPQKVNHVWWSYWCWSLVFATFCACTPRLSMQISP